MTKIINLFAGPGAGKSTMAAGLFYELKMRGHNVELATEYAKDLTWEERHETLKNQVYILGKQHHRIARLVDKVDVVITDSPILFCRLYSGESLPQSFHDCINDLHHLFDNINYFVKRKKAYEPRGRNQTADEAMAIDVSVKRIMSEAKVSYTEIEGSAEGLRHLVDNVHAAIWPS